MAEVMFFDPIFPKMGKDTRKSSLTRTMVVLSTTSGKALPTSSFIIVHNLMRQKICKMMWLISWLRLEGILDATGRAVACPLTMNCLNNTKVRNEIGDKEDGIKYLMIQVQESNDLAIHILTKYG